MQPRHLYYQYQLAALALKNAEGELKVALNAQECKLLKVCPHVCAVCLAMAVAASTVLRLRAHVQTHVLMTVRIHALQLCAWADGLQRGERTCQISLGRR